jgi:hypothetical protein
MQKSRKYNRKKTNKFSRKNKKTKKSRKFHGGMETEQDWTYDKNKEKIEELKLEYKNLQERFKHATNIREKNVIGREATKLKDEYDKLVMENKYYELVNEELLNDMINDMINDSDITVRKINKIKTKQIPERFTPRII